MRLWLLQSAMISFNSSNVFPTSLPLPAIVSKAIVTSKSLVCSKTSSKPSLIQRIACFRSLPTALPGCRTICLTPSAAVRFTSLVKNEMANVLFSMFGFAKLMI